MLGLNVRGLVPDGRRHRRRQAGIRRRARSGDDGVGGRRAVAAILVYKFLPSDRGSLEVSGEGVEVEPEEADFNAGEVTPAPVAGN